MQTQIELRNRAFVKQAMAILARHLQAGERLTRRQLVEKALASRPPSYFMEQDQVALVLGILDGKPDFRPSTERQAMWLELKKKVADLTDGPRRLRRCQAISFVLNFTRPSRFFISPKTADRLLAAVVRTTAYAVPC